MRRSWCVRGRGPDGGGLGVVLQGQEQEACTAAGVSGARRSGGGVQRRGAAAALALTADAAPDSVSRKEEKQREG